MINLLSHKRRQDKMLVIVSTFDHEGSYELEKLSSRRARSTRSRRKLQYWSVQHKMAHSVVETLRLGIAVSMSHSYWVDVEPDGCFVYYADVT